MGFFSRHPIGVLVVVVIAGWALFYVPTTPSFAVYQLKQAIDARDGRLSLEGPRDERARDLE